MASSEENPSSAGTTAMVIIAVILGAAALYWLRTILTPLAMAIFLMVMVDGGARVIRRRWPRAPGWAPLTISIVSFVVILALTVYLIADNARGFTSNLESYRPRLDALIAQAASAAHIETPPTVEDMFRKVNLTSTVRSVAGALQDFVSNAIFILIYVGFLIASRHGFERKLVTLFHDRDRRREAADVFIRVRDSIESYLWIQTLTGLMIAGAAWILMALVGLENAFFWSFVIFVLAYIPIVGAAIAIVAPAAFALVQFSGYGEAIILLTGLYAITFVVGNIILPRMQAESMNIDPVAVLLSLGFWGFLWGATGSFLSTPLTVMVMLITAQFSGTRWIAVMISEDGDPVIHAPPPGHEPKPKKSRWGWLRHRVTQA